MYRRRGERYSDVCVEESDRFGGGSVMVWAVISHNHKTQLVIVRGTLNAQRYQDNILRAVVVPFMRANPQMTLMQDNSTCQSARATRAFLAANNINVMDLTSRSPDCNPIEHLWDELYRRVKKQPNPPRTVQELEQSLVNQWAGIPQNFIQRYTGSMRRRCQAGLNANGGHTRY